MTVKNDDLIIMHYSNGSRWPKTVRGDYQMSPYFKAKELACQRGFTVWCADGFLIELNHLRKRVGFPIKLNSGCRTPEHNKDIGGHPNSLHLTENPKHPTGGCMAVDVSVNGYTPDQHAFFIATAWYNGWSLGRGDKVEDGVVSGFIHVDRRVDIGLTQNEFFYS